MNRTELAKLLSDFNALGTRLLSGLTALEGKANELDTTIQTQAALKNALVKHCADLQAKQNEQIAEVEATVAGLRKTAQSKLESALKEKDEAGRLMAEANAAQNDLHVKRLALEKERAEFELARKDLEARRLRIEEALK